MREMKERTVAGEMRDEAATGREKGNKGDVPFTLMKHF